MEKKSFLSIFMLIGVVSLLGGMTGTVRAMGKGVEAPRVSKEQLLSMMEKPDVVILDVRESESWKESKQKIRGAVREAPEKDIQGWLDKYPKEKTLVFYCS
jgi:3-mercaptopyruvate sulfurtransferase SseA